MRDKAKGSYTDCILPVMTHNFNIITKRDSSYADRGQVPFGLCGPSNNS